MPGLGHQFEENLEDTHSDISQHFSKIALALAGPGCPGPQSQQNELSKGCGKQTAMLEGWEGGRKRRGRNRSGKRIKRGGRDKRETGERVKGRREMEKAERE